MDESGTSAPGARAELAAPESKVLLDGPSAGKAVFKLAVLELVARRVLALTQEEEEEPDVFGGVRRTPCLSRGSRYAHPRARSLGSVVDLFESSPKRLLQSGTAGVPVALIAREAIRRYKGLDRWAAAEVLPTLADLGLYQRRKRGVRGIVPSSRWEITPAGEAVRADLRAFCSLARDNVRKWLTEDPDRAAAFVEGAGADILLLDELYPDLARLGHRRRRVGGGESSGERRGERGVFVGGDSGEAPDPAERDGTDSDGFGEGFDAGPLDLSGFDLGAFDVSDGGIEGTFESVDSGVDGGAWGGDGGGEDGGGGGGGGD